MGPRFAPAWIVAPTLLVIGGALAAPAVGPGTPRALLARYAAVRHGARAPAFVELTPAPVRDLLGVEIFGVGREVVLVAEGAVVPLLAASHPITPGYRLQWSLADLDGDRVSELYFYGAASRGRHQGGVCYGPRGARRGRLRCFSLTRDGDGMKVVRDPAGALLAVFTRLYPTSDLPHGRFDEAGALQARRRRAGLAFRVVWSLREDAHGRPKPAAADLQARPLPAWRP